MLPWSPSLVRTATSLFWRFSRRTRGHRVKCRRSGLSKVTRSAEGVIEDADAAGAAMPGRSAPPSSADLSAELESRFELEMHGADTS